MLSLGCHVVDLTHFLVGEIVEVVATTKTQIGSRPLPTGRDTYAAAAGDVEMAVVGIEDSGSLLLRTASGVTGVLEMSRTHSGRQNFCTIEVSGTEGAIAFDYERLNEMQLSTRTGPGGGFTRVIVGPAQDGGLVWTLGGLGVGFPETIIVHFRELMEAIDTGVEASPSFADGRRAQEVIHAALTSAETGTWEQVTPVV